jgi:hypothetical protein
MNERIRVRVVPEYPGLVISSDGRIQGPSGKWRSPWTDRDGYLNMSVPRVGGGKSITRKVHVMACTAFHGPKPSPLHQVAHANGNPADNRAENLRWATRAENEADKLRHGTRRIGERHNMVKLTEAQVLEIRAARVRGETLSSLADRYGIAFQTVSNIGVRKTWRHI